MTLKKVKGHDVLLYGLMDGLFYAWNACYLGFITTYFLACGMRAAQLSTLLALYMAACFGGALACGRLCDRLGTNKKVFIGAFSGVMAAAFAVFALASVNMKAAGAVYLILGALIASLGSNLDAWMLRVFHQDGNKYGRARGMGSFGYALMMLVGGILIQRFGYSMILIMQMDTGLLCLGLAVLLPEERNLSKMEKKGNKGSFKVLMQSHMFVLLLILLFMIGLAESPVLNMKTVFMQDAGGDVSMLGIDSFLGVSLQGVLIFFSGSIRKIPAKRRMFIVTASALLDMILIYTAVNPYMIMAGTLLWNVSYSFKLPTQRELTEKYVDPSVRNTAHSLTDAVSNNLAGILSLAYSSGLISSFGCRSVALLGAVILGVSMTAVLLPGGMKKAVHERLAGENG